jgi:hypothetical protein
LCVNFAKIEAVWHSLQSTPKKNGDNEEEEGEEKDAKKKNKGNKGGSRKPEDSSKDKEGDDSKSGEEEAAHKKEEQDGESQGEEEQGADEESADKHQVHSYIADWLRLAQMHFTEMAPCVLLLKGLLLLHTIKSSLVFSPRQFSYSPL